MNDDWLWDKSGKPDPDVEKLERSLGSLAFRAGETPVPRPKPPQRMPSDQRIPWAVAAAVAALAVTAVIGLRERGGSVMVAVLEGTPTLGSHALTERTSLGEGGWISTDAHARARVELPSIGHVDVMPGSRVRVAAIGANEQRLELARGSISAQVNAPPRLFVVDVPKAKAVDLGCAYVLATDEAGNGRLRVTSGWVSMEAHGRTSRVLDGFESKLDPVRGPGMPVRVDASPALLEAVRTIDEGFTEGAAVDALIAAASDEDAVTLWHALSRVPGPERARLVAALDAAVPIPTGVELERVLALVPAALDAWLDAIRASHSNPPSDTP